jgi:TetR/AcrR family transcriptional regulator, cholesterol catabolism regulator
MTDTRSRILAAAAQIVRDGGEPSVRAVAARAGTGLGTLRHHFPSQRALLDAVLGSLIDDDVDDGRIRDTGVAVVDRLLERLGTLLTPLGSASRAREVWRQIFRALAESGDDGAEGYAEIARQTRERVASWLVVLVEQGEIPDGDNQMRAAYLLAVVDGVAVGRAIPEASIGPSEEATILRAAVTSVIELPWPREETPPR